MSWKHLWGIIWLFGLEFAAEKDGKLCCLRVNYEVTRWICFGAQTG